jgi:uncharacterized membrane protein YfcA
MYEIPAVAADDICRILRAELSSKVRGAYLVGLLATATFAVALSSLWLTEPHLPMRTQIAFATLVAINLGWACFCLWVLTRRRVLYARQGVVAGRLAVAWSSVFVAGALAAGFDSGHVNGGLLAAAFGSVLLGCAVLMLRRAVSRHQELLALRHSLAESR